MQEQIGQCYKTLPALPVHLACQLFSFYTHTDRRGRISWRGCWEEQTKMSAGLAEQGACGPLCTFCSQVSVAL